jgi:hypothetical protein
VIVWLDPPKGAPATLAGAAIAVARAHPGHNPVKIRAGGHVLVLGERVAVCSELVRELEELDFTVGIEA